MRIKVSGELTVERLAQALAEAAALSGAHFGSFFNANIYVQTYTKEGEEYTLVNKDGSELMYHLKLSPGMPAKPAQSVAVASKMEQRKEEQKKEKVAIAADAANKQREYDSWRARELSLAQTATMKAAQLNSEFKALIVAHGETLIAAMNEAIRSAWIEQQPQMLSGINKGAPRPVPMFELDNGRVLLYADRAKSSPIKITTPVGVFKKHMNKMTPIWPNEAWALAVEKIIVVLDSFAPATAAK